MLKTSFGIFAKSVSSLELWINRKKIKKEIYKFSRVKWKIFISTENKMNKVYEKKKKKPNNKLTNERKSSRELEQQWESKWKLALIAW